MQAQMKVVSSPAVPAVPAVRTLPESDAGVAW